MTYHPEGKLIDTPENQAALASPAALADACKNETVLESRAILCDSNHNLIVELPCMRGMIPRTKAQSASVRGRYGTLPSSPA